MIKSKRLVLSLVLFSLFPQILKSQTVESIFSEELLRAINNEISGELAQEYIRYIGHWQRLQPSKGHALAAEWVAEKAREIGFSEVQVEKYLADGKKHYYMTQSELAWDVEYADLWIIEPVKEKLTSYAEIATSLAITSQTCDVEAELVYADRGTAAADYAGMDVKGKVVLATGSPRTVGRLAIDELGALGIIVMRRANDDPDIVSASRITVETPSFGFALSHRAGVRLRDRLLSGEKIKVRARVKAEVHPGYYENVIATIPGTDLADEEVVLTAHICHLKPGANDNASGCAALLEIGRTFVKLIDEGILKKPKRTIRFLWVPEMTGSIAYAATHPDVVEKMVCGINLDMVGQYLNSNNSTFFLHFTPHSQWHYVNEVLANITELVATHNVRALSRTRGFSLPVYSLSGSRDAFRYRIRGYSGGSDQTIFNDGAIGVPFAFLLVWPDRYYHTSGDKPEICDPTQLKRSSFIAAAATSFLVDDCPVKSSKLAYEVYSKGRNRIVDEEKRCIYFLNRSEATTVHSDFKETVNFIDQAYLREAASIQNVKTYSQRDSGTDLYIDDLIQKLAKEKPSSYRNIEDHYQKICREFEIAPQKPGLTDEEVAAKNIVPERNPDLKGPLGRTYLRNRLAESGRDANLPIFSASSYTSYEAFNLINGKNSLLDIRNIVSAEFEPIPVSWVKDFVELLQEADIVK